MGSSDSNTIISPLGGLPAAMKVLHIATPHRTGGWLAEAFATDIATRILLEEVVGSTAGLSRLRDEVFDAVVISHVPGELDALDIVEGLRTGGNDEPMIVLGDESPELIDAICYEAGADDYCCVNETTVRGLLWKLARALEKHQLKRENRRLIQVERQRLQQEHCEAQRLLDQQRALIEDLQQLREGRVPGNGNDESAPPLVALPAAPDRTEKPELPAALVKHYRELLRAYVIMGVGNLAEEMKSLTDHLAGSGASAQVAMQLHVSVLEDLIKGLGNRSARHVINRADLLVVEVMGHLADDYRRRFQEHLHPAQQLSLPGFDLETYRSAA